MTGGGAKRKGARLECAIKNRLIDSGWFAIKAGGSLGAFDIIAFSPQATLFIQAKSNRKPPPAEMRAMYQVAKKLANPDRVFQIWIKKDREKNYYVLDIIEEGKKYDTE